MNILVAGDFVSERPQDDEAMRAFCVDIGETLIAHGHVLLSGARSEFDALVAKAANDKLLALGDVDPGKRIISYVLSGTEPVHGYGTRIRSRLTNWELANETFYIPEQVRAADAVVLVGGFQGTFRAANWAKIAKKPLLPFPGFEGAGAKIFEEELNDFDAKYAGLVEKLDYERLNSVSNDWPEIAETIISLAERVAESRSVMVIMSYAKRAELDDVFAAFEQVAQQLGYTCDRVTEENAVQRILPEILERISRAAFTIVDLTDLRPNVFYEFGYANGLGKRVIVTAKEGTELPFDVKDIPTIFWDGKEQLKTDLRARIETIVKTGVAAATAPLG